VLQQKSGKQHDDEQEDRTRRKQREQSGTCTADDAEQRTWSRECRAGAADKPVLAEQTVPRHCTAVDASHMMAGIGWRAARAAAESVGGCSVEVRRTVPLACCRMEHIRTQAAYWCSTVHPVQGRAIATANAITWASPSCSSGAPLTQQSPNRAREAVASQTRAHSIHTVGIDPKSD
jgi:hypothetical protein